MVVLEIVGGLLVVAAILFLLHSLDKHYDKKFGHRFFKLSAFIILAVAVGFVWGGQLWYESALKDGGDTLNGIACMVIGGLIVIGMVVFNLKRTNLVYGLLGSFVQIAIFGTLAYVSMPLLAALVVFRILAFFRIGASQGYVVHSMPRT
ncbi:hypothetical protein L1D19_23450 [Vibrio natriegens]|uniref:hypothetical protein n=1 Tax=Vibrio natriegens TaxID=691 RepID=UPI001EFE0790|nr:hypothetical protein [Vibrio natriegens]MCG9703024.1 hypothetical protein [Vibrio natriegens]